MSRVMKISIASTVILALSIPALAQQSGSQRAGYGYRESAEHVIKRLRLKPDFVIADIGAGDGWWASKIAEKLGPDGIIHAGEVDQKKVDAMTKKWSEVKQIKPYLCPTDGTGQEPDSCDMVFLSKTYHHLNADGHIDYLKHLKEVIKPTGKLIIIERHPALATGRAAEHGCLPGLLARDAEQAGWMLLKCELIPGSDHFIATFVQAENFTKAFAKRMNAAKKKKESATPEK